METKVELMALICRHWGQVSRDLTMWRLSLGASRATSRNASRLFRRTRGPRRTSRRRTSQRHVSRRRTLRRRTWHRRASCRRTSRCRSWAVDCDGHATRPRRATCARTRAAERPSTSASTCWNTIGWNTVETSSDGQNWKSPRPSNHRDTLQWTELGKSAPQWPPRHAPMDRTGKVHAPVTTETMDRTGKVHAPVTTDTLQWTELGKSAPQ